MSVRLGNSALYEIVQYFFNISLNDYLINTETAKNLAQENHLPDLKGLIVNKQAAKIYSTGV